MLDESKHRSQSEAERAADRSASWIADPDPAHVTRIEDNFLFSLRRERFHSRATSTVHDYYVIHLADAVHVIAITPDQNIVLVEQFRAGSGRDSLETPGGLLEPGEDPLNAGARELLEETGYAGDRPIFLGSVWANPSLLTSRISTILIRDAQRVAEPDPDATEELRVRLIPIARVPSAIRDGTIDHALVVQGLLWWLASPESAGYVFD